MGSLEERQEYTPDGQELPPWQEYRLVSLVPVLAWSKSLCAGDNMAYNIGKGS